jgi:photosystem II stability/assembly factor-like uncharacterized protein
VANDFTICAGTVGSGIWYSADSGQRWSKSSMELPFFAEIGDIRALSMAASPHDRHRLLAGSEVGLHISDDNGMTWKLLDFPINGSQIWSIAFDPSDKDVILVGTKPPAVFRSGDGGKRWEKLDADFPPRCPIPIGPPRVLALVFDPTDRRSIWAGVEVGGIFHSADGGESWDKLPPLGGTETGLDIHGIAISAGSPKKVLVTTPRGIWTSVDEGQSWAHHGFRFAGQDHGAYTRGVAVKAGDPDVIFVGNGNVVFGDKGELERSTDGGRTWATMPLPAPPNSTVYGFATNRADPDTILANTLYGYIYMTRDGGDSWRKIDRELSEIRALAWMPNN